MKKRILIAISNYLPGHKIGGPLTSVLNMIDLLGDDFGFCVVTSDRDMGDSEPYPDIHSGKWIRRSNYSVFYVPGGLTASCRLLKIISKTEKDFLYLNSLFDPLFSILITIAWKFSILRTPELIIAPRGELFDEALGFKPFKKQLYIRIARLLKIYSKVRWHASTYSEKESIIKMLNVAPEKINVAINLAKTDMSLTESGSNVSWGEPDNDNCLRIIYLARVSKDKNIPFTFDVLAKVDARVKFDIYGPIEDDFIWDICLRKIKSLPANITVEYKGYVRREEVRKTLSRYDLFFLPTFAENFGHSIAESLSAGTPVLISDRTPWRDLAKEDLGWDLDLNEPEAFVKVINEFSGRPPEVRSGHRQKIIETFRKRFSDPMIIEQTKNIFR